MRQDAYTLNDQPLRQTLHQKSLSSSSRHHKRDIPRSVPISQYHVSTIATPKRSSHAPVRHISEATERPMSPRERNLAVANVGGDGVIYLKYSSDQHGRDTNSAPFADSLRPTEKSSNYSAYPPSYGLPPSPFVLPPSPPASNSDRGSQGDAPDYWHDRLHESAAAVYAAANKPGERRANIPSLHTPSAGSTPLPSQTDLAHKQQQSGYNYNYLHPDLTQSKAASPVDSPMLLQVAIPSYRIGVPRFSNRGTLIFHESFLSLPSESDDNRESKLSKLELDDVFPAPPGANSVSPFLNPSYLSFSAADGLPKPINGIDPSIYDAFVRDSNNAKYITFLPDGQIFAATPARLIAHITHVDFLDYDLLSDFFLTYRSFLGPKDLLRFLIARLRWAVFRKDETGRIVRVRTFVAIRHWILNYFMDDFEPDYDLRLLFCDLVNVLARELSKRRELRGDLQVVAELKKCWRRTCDIIWGTSKGTHAHLPADNITPGGKDNEGNNSLPLSTSPLAQQDFFSRPAFPEMQRGIPCLAPIDLTSIVTSPTSPWRFRQSSFDVTSCSIPMWKTFGRSIPSFRPRALMPIPDRDNHVPEISKLPSKAHRHKKSKSSKGSTGTAAINDVAHNDQIIFDPRNDLGTFKSGHLIRGMLLAPPLPQITKQVRIHARTPSEEEREGTLSHVVDQVKRKLSTRDGSPSKKRDRSGSTNSSRLELRAKGADAQNNLMVVSQSDLLAAFAAESYEQLVREDIQGDKSSTEKEQQRPPTRHGHQESNVSKTDFNKDSSIPPSRYPTQRQHSHMTTSSRSIMIINDTRHTEPVMTFDLHDMVIPAENHNQQSPPRKFNMPFNQGTRAVDGSALQDSPAHFRPRWENAPLAYAPAGIPRRVLQSMTSSVAQSEATSHGLGLFVPEGEASSAVDMTTRDAYRQSSIVEPLVSLGPALNKQLRRRPGGDLRAVDNVDDLSSFRPRRNSTGSIALRRMSRTTSATMSTEIVDAQYASKLANPRIVSNYINSGVTSRTKKSSLKLLSTHSSQPNFRASFQVEVDKLAELHGVDIDDGGVDSTLAKLEGRVTAPTSPVPDLDTTPAPYQPPNSVASDVEPTSHAIVRPDHSETQSVVLSGSTPRAEVQTLHMDRPWSRPFEDDEVQQASNFRFPQDEYVIQGDAGPPSDVGSLAGRWSYIMAPSPRNSSTISKKNWPLGSAMDIKSPVRQVSILGSSSNTKSSFLLDEHQDFSEDGGVTPISREDERNKSRSQNEQSRPNTISTHGDCSFFLEEDEEEKHPSPTLNGFSPPLSPPPSTPLPALPFSPPPLYDPVPSKAAERLRTPTLPEGQHADRSRPYNATHADVPNPEAWSKAGSADDFVLRSPPKPMSKARFTQSDPVLTSSPSVMALQSLHPPHTPFISAFSSEVLAAQFTVIERDALEEIDWKELVELRWSKAPTSVLNWAEYMRIPGQTGVDIVIARFNLVVKWAVSEVLLTSDIQVRANAITKLIHIASHARRLRNYATAYQLTIALLSTAVSRLRKTWEMVHQAEKDTLASLEQLVQPMRNFAALRQEMEASLLAPGLSASGTTSPIEPPSAAQSAVYVSLKPGACIPFIGVYTHDLAYIAQKPAFVDATGNAVSGPAPGVPAAGAAMVNFERFQTAAAAVKNMLRLLEASAKYTIRPNKELVARCLWLAALEDGDIEARSRSLE